MTKCLCGKDLHYESDVLKKFVEKIVEDHGEFVEVTNIVTNKKYNVSRHYIALHGLTGAQLRDDGIFEEVK